MPVLSAAVIVTTCRAVGLPAAADDDLIFTIQVNLDFESEADMVEKMRIGIALQPLATALFANSPFRDGKDTGGSSPVINIDCACTYNSERPLS